MIDNTTSRGRTLRFLFDGSYEEFKHCLLYTSNMQEYLDRGMDAEMGIATADAMAAERASMMQADAWRSLLMIDVYKRQCTAGCTS